MARSRIGQLEALRKATGVAIEATAMLTGCSHYTYKKLVRGNLSVGDWDDGLRRAFEVLQAGFEKRVLPTVDKERREKILALLLRARSDLQAGKPSMAEQKYAKAHTLAMTL